MVRRIRRFPENNYVAVFADGKTARLPVDSSRPIGYPPYPEIVDVAINDKCFGKCSYCYISAVSGGTNYPDILEKCDMWLGGMEENDRPLQIAIGGAGEPTLHPDFPEFLEKVFSYNVLPNFTTNGMHLSKVLPKIRHLDTGVALTTHPHLDRFWRKGVERVNAEDMFLNLHIIIGEQGSMRRFSRIYREYKDAVKYFVLLHYKAIGRAKPVERETEFKALRSWLEENPGSQVAFGAGFSKFLEDNADVVQVYKWPEHAYSAYLDFNSMGVWRSSFEWNTPALFHLGGNHEFRID